MSLPSLPPFKLELTHNGKKITFGKRFKGDVGRDILSVKVALGLVKSIDGSMESGDQTVSFDPNIPFDRQKWFSCSTGLGMDLRRASTFDSAMEKALANFQVQNQFLITCYLFEKFGVREIIGASRAHFGDFPLDEYDASLGRQLESAIILFDNEYGTLQEATIAVLHGWRPLSTVSNKLYIHDANKYNNDYPVTDVIPEALAADLRNSQYPQSYVDLVENEIVIPGSFLHTNHDKLTKYVENVSSNSNWVSIIDWFGTERISSPFRYSSLDYYPVLSGESSLYSAVKQVVALIETENDYSEIMTPEERDQAARRLIYPNPFTDPDPFIISGTKIGFYDNTEYFISDLQNNVNLPQSDPETIKVLEEKALIKVLQHYNKPQVWNFLRGDPDFLDAYFPGTGNNRGYSPLHSGRYPSEYTAEQILQMDMIVNHRDGTRNRNTKEFKRENFHVLSTSNITNQLSEQNETDVRYWRTIDSFPGTEPLIKFIEYATPSLRPGETYRALFEVNREKLEAIQAGETIFEEQLSTEPPPEIGTQEQSSACPDQNFNQSNRTYQEYRTHAIKKRREIVRKLRNQILERSNREQGAQVDLGEYGPFDLNSAFSSAIGVNLNSYSDYEFTKKVLSLAPELLELLNVATFDIDLLEGYIKEQEDRNTEKTTEGDVNILTISIEELRYRAELATQDLRKAHEIILRENITFHQGSSFDAANEAAMLESYIGNLVGKTKVPEAQWGKTELTIRFRNVFVARPGPDNGKIIASINVGSTPLDIGPLAEQSPRTINYVAFLKKMTGGTFSGASNFLKSFFDDSQGSCKEIGIDFEKHITRALIGKYTSGLKLVASDEADSDAFLSWFKQNFEDPAHSWWETTKQNAEGSLRDRFNEKQALRLLGDTCKFVGRGNIFEQFFDKLDLASLMCDYLKCIKLPGFDFKMPQLFVPPPPEIPIVGWYSGLLQFLKDQFAQAALRVLCTFVRTIIDKVAFPFCQEQLEEFISAGSSASPLMNKALIDALTNTGITSKNNEKAKDFFDKTANILTPRELCYLLDGKRLDDPTMLMIQKIASSAGLEGDLDSFSAIENFYGVIGTYISFDFCENLSQFDTLPNVKNCEDTEDLLLAIRNRLLSADPTLTESEISQALDIAVNNSKNQQLALEVFQEEGLAGMAPDFFKLGDPNAVISEYPEFLKEELENTAEYMFQGAKTSYYKSLSRYVPAMIAEAPINLNAYDDAYDEIQTLRFEAAIQQLEDLAKQFPPDPNDVDTLELRPSGSGDSDGGLDPRDYEWSREDEPADNIIKLSSQYAALHQLYQVERINGNMVHRRRFKLSIDPTYLESQYLAIQQQITYLNTRINRTSGGKQRRLELERGMAQAQLRAILAKLESISDPEASEHTISYDEYLKYLEAIKTMGPTEEVPEFELVPFKLGVGESLSSRLQNALSEDTVDSFQELERNMRGTSPLEDLAAMQRDLQAAISESSTAVLFDELSKYSGLYSIELEHYQLQLSEPEYDNRSFRDILDPGKNAAAKILTIKQIVAYHESITGEDGSDPGLTEVLRGARLVQDRIASLRDRISEILNSRPSIVGSQLLPGLQALLNKSTEATLESRFDRGSIETEDSITKLSFATGSLYAPEIIMTEYEAGFDKDRYDIKIVGDIFLNLPPGSSKVFKFCDKIPKNSYVEPSAQPIFAKREILSKMIINNISRTGLRPSEELSEEISSILFQNMTETALEQIIDAASESRLFQSCYADPLDARVSGRRVINENCISNRFSFGDASILNFKEVVLDDVVKEIAKEQAKPENDPINSDFSKPTPVDLALQTVALKGFIKMCLIDALLKGGLSFAVWDLEPIASEELYIKYLYEHTLRELNDNNSIRDIWPFILERSTGIFSKHDALESVIREEILNLPNYSKQIFNFKEIGRDFYRWPTDSFIPQFIISQEKKSFEEDKFNYVLPSETITGHQYRYVSDKPTFMIEHYIKLTGLMLEEVYDRLRIPDIQRNGTDLILSLDEFYTAIARDPQRDASLSYDEYWWADLIGGTVIEQGARLVSVQKTEFKSDSSPRGWDYQGARDQEDFRIVDDIQDIFIKAFAKDPNGEAFLVPASAAQRSYRVETSDGFVAFAVPLVSVERRLDFKECYSLNTYFDQNEFFHKIPHMIDELYNNSDCILLLEHVIPFRRFMSVSTIFTTSILSAFNDMPSLFDSPKNQLASVALITTTAPNKRKDLLGMTQDQFERTIMDNFPSDQKDWDCVEVPNISKDFWNDFFDQMAKLALKLPSILFRGLAGTMDPAYKEMKAHYHNCDLRNLTWDGLRPAGTVDGKLVNGVYLGKTADDRQRNAQTGYGTYVPVVLGSLSDFGYTASSLVKGDFKLFGSRLEKTVLKLITYAYNGNAPFLDPSFYFKVPCNDYKTRQKWEEYGKYDAGKYGRYGHPLSPLTALALTTPQLEGDKRIKEDNCRIVENPNYCEDISAIATQETIDFRNRQSEAGGAPYEDELRIKPYDQCEFEPDWEGMQPNYGRYIPPSREGSETLASRNEVEEDIYATNEMAQDYGYDSADDLGDTESRLLRRLWEIEKKPSTPAGIDTQGDLDYQSFMLYHMLYGTMRPLNTNSDRYLEAAKGFDKMKIAYLDWEIQVERVRSLENERIETRDALNFQRLDWPPSEMYTWPPPFWKPNTEGMDLSEGYRRRILGPIGDTSIDYYSMDILESAQEYRLKYAQPYRDL